MRPLIGMGRSSQRSSEDGQGLFASAGSRIATRPQYYRQTRVNRVSWNAGRITAIGARREEHSSVL
ncbi:MAG TPA: hypothetical protein VFF88_05590, partial [Methylocella sp.]|nr:hypothetical protein [Methylocella sp.]